MRRLLQLRQSDVLRDDTYPTTEGGSLREVDLLRGVLPEDLDDTDIVHLKGRRNVALVRQIRGKVVTYQFIDVGSIV